MKLSPIQLLQVMFKHVKVELDTAHQPENIPNPLNSSFTFDGVALKLDAGYGLADETHERGPIYFVELRILVDNIPQPEKVGQQFSPYTLDVALEGVILVPQGAENPAPPDDLAFINGLAMLWSAAREQILSLTSRMRAGPVMLPTVHFHDLRKENMPYRHAAGWQPTVQP
jgi:preprotein translocase subunit SecB